MLLTVDSTGYEQGLKEYVQAWESKVNSVLNLAPW